MIGAGDLRERVAFDRRVEIDDGAGNTVGAFVEQFAVAARVMPLKGSEAVLASRLEGRQPVVITVRSSGQTRAITADWQARDTRTGMVYAITAAPAAMVGNRAFLDILATSGAAA